MVGPRLSHAILILTIARCGVRRRRVGRTSSKSLRNWGSTRRHWRRFVKALDIDPGYLPARMRLADTLTFGGHLDAERSAYEALTRDVAELALAHYRIWASAFAEFLRRHRCFTAVPFGSYAARAETFLVSRRS
jgi:hypothetical protein